MKDEVVRFRKAIEYFDSKRANKLIKDFKEILAERQSPSIHWDCMAYGAFKECYDAGDPNFIIKFASCENDTITERKTLQLAIDAGFSLTFPKTIYIPLSVNLPVSIIEGSPSQEYRYTYHSYRPIPEEDKIFLNYVIIQRRIVETAENRHKEAKMLPIWSKTAYEEEPIIVNNIMLPYELLEKSSITNRGWISSIINKRGHNYFADLAKFLDYNCISDLHSKNIGYTADNEPVIFDWLS